MKSREKYFGSIENNQSEGRIINLLVMQKILSTQEAVAVTPEQIDELILRLGNESLDEDALQNVSVREKIRRNLNLSPEKDGVIDTEKRQQEIQEAQAEMEQYLLEIQKEHPEINGLILHGSRFNAHKVPDDTSDFDTIVLLENGTPTERDTDEHSEYLTELIEYIHNKKSPTGKEVQLNEFFTSETLQQLLEHPDQLQSLNWVWTPDAVRYVGKSVKIGESVLSAEEFTQYISDTISQEAIQQAKDKMLAKARQRLLESE